ncbi:MAG: EAL domain-containing protein [Clostridia bacterium]|nr:EAL domain-containing protein [Clostridia bacterium]
MPDNAMQHSGINGSKRRILIVAGDPSRQRFLSEALQGQYDVVYAQTGAEALEAVYGGKDLLALVLLDFALPDSQGKGILKQITEDPMLKSVSVIVMSRDRQDEVYALNNGAMDFILKPCDLTGVVLARVRHVIELSENRSIIRSTERDQLTGLYNKDFFFNYANQYDVYHQDMDMDAMVVNISHFHMINERHGKAYGDDVLRRVGGKILQSVSGEGGIVCRRDGDTFLIYCPHRDNYEAILKEAATGMDSRVRLRMGVYPHVDKSLDIERRFDRAKLASDTVRDSFTKTVALYDEQMHRTEIYTEQLLEDFPTAIAEKQFVVYYQPKFAIQGTMPVLNSAEALVRWNHPRFGMVSPGNFIPLFESNGLIRQLDSFVWREVAAQMRDWKDRLGICVPVSVNVSRVDIFDYDLVDHMKGLIREFGLSPDEFLLEITESAYTQNSAQIISTVNALREAGFHIEIDDFGSGYSSLNMISTLPMDALKLDMEFMHNAFKERKNTKMLDAVIDIAYSLEVPTIAEGVETAEQMFALKAMGCDIVQGFYFSKPLPAAEFERFLLEKKNGRTYQPDRDKESKVRAAEQFAYEALHDPLTGLYNHSAYKMLLKDADQRNIALILADVDDYDAIRAEQGEAVTNRMSELVADVLRHNFRSVDFICRIAMDEYAVIMTRVNNDMKPLIRQKVERINAMLRERQRDLPPINLSVGVAFADRENPQGDIFHDADQMLQQMKNVKSTGCAIF